jgi:hypothetical protein
MHDAYERFGTLEFVKRTKDTTTRVRAHFDRAILEPAKADQNSANAHLISMIGGDAEIGALRAAVAEGALFRIQLPDNNTDISVCLGPEAQSFRGGVMVPGRTRPVRHLVAISAELAKTKPGTDREGTRTILCDDEPLFVLYRVAYRYGLPAVPEWARWFMRELKQRKAIVSLLGFGCSPVLVKGNKHTFLRWIGRSVKDRTIQVPDKNGSVTWKASPDFFKTHHLPQAQELNSRALGHSLIR